MPSLWLRVMALAGLVAGSPVFTISNGQIFTPGFVVLNAPQPYTPLGGETLHLSLDVTANGKLPQPPYPRDSSSQIFNVTVYLYSYDTGRNFTVADGTTGEDADPIGEILAQEPGSTVKHVNWVWPDCLVGDGSPTGEDSDRGIYNITIRQNFRIDDEDHYTILDVPISVTNSIEDMDKRPSCDALGNALLSPEEIDAVAANEIGILFAPGGSSEEEYGNLDDDDDDDDDDDEGLGDQRPEAEPEDGLGAGVGLSVTAWQVIAVLVTSLSAVFL